MSNTHSRASEPEHLADRRRTPRHSTRAQARLQLEAGTLTSRVENLSPGGVLLYTDSDLRVSVEVEHEGELRTYSGRIVRLQRMRGEATGLAIEFDEPARDRA